MIKTASWQAVFSLTASMTLAACGGGNLENTPVTESAQALDKAQVILSDAEETLSSDAQAIIWPVFKVKELQTLTDSPSTPVAMNDRGQVIGYEFPPESSEEKYLVFGNAGRPASDLNLATARMMTAFDINNRGAITGTSPGDVPFLFNPGTGSVAELTDSTGLVQGLPLSLNDKSQVVGLSQGQAVLFGPSGGLGVALAALPGSFSSAAFAINNRSQIVGRSDFDFGLRWQATLFNALGGPAKDLGKLPNGFESMAMALNENGLAVGFTNYKGDPVSCLSAVRRATLFKIWGGKPVKLDTISNEPVPCSASSLAYAINNLGQVVGFVGDAGISTKPRSSHGFLWQNGVMRRLDSLLKPGSGWHINEAIDIDEAGNITAIGIQKATGRQRALLLTPVSPVIQ